MKEVIDAMPQGTTIIRRESDWYLAFPDPSGAACCAGTLAELLETLTEFVQREGIDSLSQGRPVPGS